MNKIIKDRHDHITQECQNKTVLNLGCIGNINQRGQKYVQWLHKNITEVAKKCEGIDNDKKNIPLAAKQTKTKIHYGNVIKFNLKKKYDIIVAGEIIEHIDNFRSFFNSIKKHMKKNSKLIITTPNVFNISNIGRLLLTGKVIPEPMHLVFFDIHTLKHLLRENKLKIINYSYGTDLAPQRIRNIIIRTIGTIIPIFNLTLMVTVKKNDI